MALCDSYSGSLWLPLALTCSLRLSLALSGCYWISPSLRVSLWLSMALCDSHSSSHWLSLPLSDILWPSLAHYCSLISRKQPLISSEGPCSALIADATITMTHFLPLWTTLTTRILLYLPWTWFLGKWYRFCQKKLIVVVLAGGRKNLGLFLFLISRPWCLATV